jgi:hypothetical protein
LSIKEESTGRAYQPVLKDERLTSTLAHLDRPVGRQEITPEIPLSIR